MGLSFQIERLRNCPQRKNSNSISSSFPINKNLANQAVKTVTVTFGGIYVTFGGNITTLRGHSVTFRGDRSRFSAQLHWREWRSYDLFAYRNRWELPILEPFRDRNFLGKRYRIVTSWGENWWISGVSSPSALQRNLRSGQER
jgi:hypothetical protein